MVIRDDEIGALVALGKLDQCGFVGIGGNDGIPPFAKQGTRSLQYNWNVVNNELANGRPVIISVRVPGTNYDYNGDGSNHWIVITGLSGGRYTIHDPYWTNSGYSLSDVRSMKTLK